MSRLPHVLALVGLLSSSGCLFVGDVNERPTARILALSDGEAHLGRSLRFEVDVSDDQDSASSELVLLDDKQERVTDPCVFRLAQVGPHSPQTSYELILWQAGTYTLMATPVDRLAARGSPSSFQITVENEPPVFASTTPLAPAAAPDACGIHYTTQPILIRLDSDAIDPEAGRMPPPDGCKPIAPRLVHRYILTDRPTLKGSLGRPYGLSCPAQPIEPGLEVIAEGGVCLYPDPDIPTGSPSSYQLVLQVEDGTPGNERRSSPLTLVVIGDAPACLDGTYPAVGAYTLPRDTATVFYALGVDDVEPALGLSYVWSIERAGESGFTVLGSATGEEGGGRFSLDPIEHGFAVGETARLRVEVVQVQSTAACALDDDTCAVDSCAASGATCPRRATWTLEYR